MMNLMNYDNKMCVTRSLTYLACSDRTEINLLMRSITPATDDKRLPDSVTKVP